MGWKQVLALTSLLTFGQLVICSEHVSTSAETQQDVNHLLYKITEPIRERYTKLKAASTYFNPLKDLSLYSDDGHATQKLMDELENGLLQKKHWFSLFNERQREEALMLFEVLMTCKDWTGFASNAAFFREKMNEGEFIYALYAAVTHSRLTTSVILPPLYEVTPHMFTNREVIQKAYSAKMTQTPGEFRMNFTGSPKNPEQRIAYFGEDIGLNTHHVSWHMDFPFWWKDSYGYELDRKGELFFWIHHQLISRFDSERMSNNLNMVEELHWDKPIVEGFAPHTSYRYGGEFPSRPDNKMFEDVDGVAHIRDMILMEHRIRDAIALGYITDKKGETTCIRNDEGINILGHILESSMYSPNPSYYGALHNLGHVMLGRQSDPHGKFNMPPGVMEHFETSTRDPSFFRLHKYIDNIFKEHKDSFEPYSKDNLSFPGIKVSNVEASPLKTYFEDFKFDLEMAVDDTPLIEDVPMSAIVSRLNHEEFTMEIEVENTGEERVGTVRVFLCPAEDQYGEWFTFETGRWHCIELDKFWETLKPGNNKIRRHSSQSTLAVPDIVGFKKLMEMTDNAIDNNQKLTNIHNSRSCGIPNRLLLPKGRPEGMKFWLSVFVSDAHDDLEFPDTLERPLPRSFAHCGVRGEKYPDRKPLGFPFDRRIINDDFFLDLDTFSGKLVEVYHIEHP